MKTALTTTRLLTLSLLVFGTAVHADVVTQHESVFEGTTTDNTEDPTAIRHGHTYTIDTDFLLHRRQPSEPEPTSPLFAESPSSKLQHGPGLPRILPQQGHWLPAGAMLPDGSRVSATDASPEATVALAPFAKGIYRGTQQLHEQGETPTIIGQYQPHFQDGFQEPLTTWARADQSPSFPKSEPVLIKNVPAGLEQNSPHDSPYSFSQKPSPSDAERYGSRWSGPRPDVPQHMPDGSYSALNEYGVPVAYTPDGLVQAVFVDGQWLDPTPDRLKEGLYVTGDYAGAGQGHAPQSSPLAGSTDSDDTNGSSRSTVSSRQTASSGRSTGGNSSGTSSPLRVFDVANNRYTTDSPFSGGSGSSGAGSVIAQSGLPEDMKKQLTDAAENNPDAQQYLEQRENLANGGGINTTDGSGTYAPRTQTGVTVAQPTSTSEESTQDKINAILMCGTNVNMAMNQPECMNRVKSLCKFDWKKGVMHGPAACGAFIGKI